MSLFDHEIELESNDEEGDESLDPFVILSRREEASGIPIIHWTPEVRHDD
jgi:hypothetical protein